MPSFPLHPPTVSTHSLSPPAVQAINVTVESKGLLEWFPEPTIPFAGSRFRQTIHVCLAPGAGPVLWDALASGRIAQGERWAMLRLPINGRRWK